MNRILALLLLLQLGLVTTLYWPDDSGPVTRSALLEDVERPAITRLEITDGEGNSVTLARSDAGWQLDTGLPADTAKVTALLDALLSQDPGFAIARSESAATRFDVAEDGFERRIELAIGNATRVLYLGSSPSFRKVHARIDGDSAVYVLAFNSYDAPANVIGWLDRSLLAMRDLKAVTLDDAMFELDDDRWLDADGAPADPEAMETLLTALAGLQVSGISDAENETAAAASAVLRIAGDTTAGNRSGITVLENREAELYYLRGDGIDALFNTSSYDAERLLSAAKTLTVNPEIDAGDAAASQPPVVAPPAVEDGTAPAVSPTP